MKRQYLLLILLASIALNITIASYGYHAKWGKGPDYGIAIMMAPLAKPIALGGFLQLFEPFDRSKLWLVATPIYWIVIFSLVVYGFIKRKLIPLLLAAILGALASPLWFIIGVGLFYI